MHISISSGYPDSDADDTVKSDVPTPASSLPGAGSGGGYSMSEEDKELRRYLDKAYIAPKERKMIPKKIIDSSRPQKTKDPCLKPEYLIVDGYNIIFAWDELKALAKVNLDSAREALIEILENYQGYRKCNVVAVFDAYRVKGGTDHTEKIGDLEVVFTGEGETADTYIERMTYEMKKKYIVRVASSDTLEQMIATGNDALRMSAEDLRKEIELANDEISAFLEEYTRKNRTESINRIKL